MRRRSAEGTVETVPDIDGFRNKLRRRNVQYTSISIDGGELFSASAQFD
jgi:hypothetical protein